MGQHFVNLTKLWCAYKYRRHLFTVEASGFIHTLLFPQDALSSLTRNALSRKLDSYSDVCEAFKIVELLLGFLSLTGGDPTMPLVTYLKDILKMADHIDHHILQVNAYAASLSGVTVKVS